MQRSQQQPSQSLFGVVSLGGGMDSDERGGGADGPRSKEAAYGGGLAMEEAGDEMFGDREAGECCLTASLCACRVVLLFVGYHISLPCKCALTRLRSQLKHNTHSQTHSDPLRPGRHQSGASA